MPVFNPKDVEGWCGGTWGDVPSTELRGVSIDTRSIFAGNLFIAIRGPRLDGHAFLSQAFSAGASAAIVSDRSLRSTPSHPLLYVADTQKALTSLAQGYRATLQAEMLALTGSVGKTTAKELIADLLSEGGLTGRTRGNLNNDLGLPLSLLAFESTNRFGVFELGMNHPGELAPLCKLVRPAWGVMTAIGPVHIEFFTSVRAIAEEKATLFRTLPPQGVAVACQDDEWFPVLRDAAPCRLVTTSLVGPADYSARIVSEEKGLFDVQAAAGGEAVRLMIPVPGRHTIYNALLAVAVAREHGIDWDRIAAALRRYAPPPMRWNRVELRGMTVINDAYNANPLSMRSALRTFAGMSEHAAHWLVLAGMKELGASEHAEHLALGTEIATGTWTGLVTVGPLGAQIAEGAAQAGFPGERIFRCKDHAEAAQVLAARVEAGGAVLLKASRSERMEEVLTKWRQVLSETARV